MKSKFLFLLFTVAVGVQAEIKPGTPQAAQAMALPYLTNRFIVVAPAEVKGDEAKVKALFMGQECTLNMVRAPISQNQYGWTIYGSICGARTGAEQEKWMEDFDAGRMSNLAPGGKLITPGTNN
ncbi:hypothetical protein I6U33_26785 [Pseudomonas carnis]|uniref:hypothetical protein n=1 Tax=Pseudomonas carnis TaxID=2487355 RepID=UPI001C6F73D1|nr:hypothetical protein [Pseudomonas carnis]MBW9240939.1 hypothetical protein [Pseudomonas carnis]